jgi:hypothetical protein
MRNSEELKGLLVFVTALMCMSVSAWAEDAVSKQGKKYSHPHTLHLEVMGQGPADFSQDEIRDWPGFVSSLQKKGNAFPFSQEGRMVLSGLKPDSLSSDDMALLVNELNRLLTDENVGAGQKGRSGNVEDLKWINRGLLSDAFPQLARKEKGKTLKKITCSTCHEAYVQAEKDAEKNRVDEKTVIECFSNAISGKAEGKGEINECLKMADTLKKTRIQPYGPLRNVIQRSVPEGAIPFFVAIHPEDPYTYKPLLKRLVCLECHGQDRKVDRITGRDGKVKKIQIFYGAGSGKHKHKHEEESQN